MQNARRIMLFSPLLAPVPVAADRPLVIGRQAHCDMPLRHSDVSRQHAEVSFEAGQYVLRDLGSTNGTFLNGKEISSPTPLSPGDRIELGSRIVTFCELAPEGLSSLADLDGDQTLIASRTPDSETFAGDLSQIPTSAVLQLLEMESKTGVLAIDTWELCCEIWFRDGVPVHAESQKQSGFDAALSIVNLERGRFRFEAQPVDTAPTLSCTVTELLMEGCRVLDEQRA